MKKCAVMFDLDGTLLDSLADLGDSMNIVLKKLGFPIHDYPFYRQAVGDGAPQLVARALPPEARVPDTMQTTLAQMQTEYEQRWNLKTRPYEGIVALLNELRQRQIATAVLSNKFETKTRDCITHFFPDAPFTVVRGARTGVPLKPDPAAALDIMRELDIPADEWLYVGDTDTDMQTAVNAAMFAVGVSWGFRDRNELLTYGAQAIIEKPEDLLTLLD